MKEKDVDLSARAAELYYTLCKQFIPKSKINVEYYPYTSLKGTGKMRDSVINIRISDAFKDSPQDVKNALIAILLCKIAKKPCPPAYTAAFRDYVNSSYMTCLQKELRKFRGKELLVEPKGNVYNLNDSFERINKKYFNGEFKMINGKYFDGNPKMAGGVELNCSLEEINEKEINEKHFDGNFGNSNDRNFNNKLETINGKHFNDDFKVDNRKCFNNNFKEVNERYFNEDLKGVNENCSNDKFEKPRIGWSVGRAKNRLGYLDSTTGIIRISRILDDKRVPIYVLDYIVYHELLHLKHETVYRNCRRTVHTREFKKDEKRYEEYESANKWLKANIWRCGRVRHKWI